MWKEITINNVEEINKIVNMADVVGCWFMEDSIDILKRQLTIDKYEFRSFYYKDDTFEIAIDFRLLPDEEAWEGMRCYIKWDINDSSINPLDALKITGKKTKEFMEETGRNIVFKEARTFDRVSDILKTWYNNNIVTIYNPIGIRATYQDNGKQWLFELI